MKKRSAQSMVALIGLVLLMFGGHSAFAYAPNGPAIAGNTTIETVSAPMTLTWTGFQPLEFVGNIAHSNSVVLPTIQANATGGFVETIMLPPSLLPGPHEIVATGLTSGRVATFDFTITGATSTPGTVPFAIPPSGSSGGTPSGKKVPAGSAINLKFPSSPLAYTGSDVALICAVAAGALAIGGLLILISRKRHIHHTT